MIVTEKEDKERSNFGRKYKKLSLCHDKFEIIISGIFKLILQHVYMLYTCNFGKLVGAAQFF